MDGELVLGSYISVSFPSAPTPDASCPGDGRNKDGTLAFFIKKKKYLC